MENVPLREGCFKKLMVNKNRHTLGNDSRKWFLTLSLKMFSKWQDTSKSGNLEKINDATTTKQAASRVFFYQLTRYSFVVNVPILAHYARPKFALLWSPKCHFLDHCLRKWITRSGSWPWGPVDDNLDWSRLLFIGPQKDWSANEGERLMKVSKHGA